MQNAYSDSITLGFCHDSVRITVQMLCIHRHTIIGDPNNHLISLDGRPFPASETSDRDIRPSRNDRNSFDILTTTLERCGGELCTPPARSGLQRHNPINSLRNVSNYYNVRYEIGIFQGADNLSFGLERHENTFVDHFFGSLWGIVGTDVEMCNTRCNIRGSITHSQDTSPHMAGFLFRGQSKTFAFARFENSLTV